MDNKKIVKQYFNKYFKQQYFTEDDYEFKSLLRILNKKDKLVQNLSGVVKPFYCWNSKCDGKRCKNQCMGCEYYEEKELKQ
jgi:hypothetical protein